MTLNPAAKARVKSARRKAARTEKARGLKAARPMWELAWRLDDEAHREAIEALYPVRD